jgi:hypothetical protein
VFDDINAEVERLTVVTIRGVLRRAADAALGGRDRLNVVAGVESEPRVDRPEPGLQRRVIKR